MLQQICSQNSSQVNNDRQLQRPHFTFVYHGDENDHGNDDEKKCCVGRHSSSYNHFVCLRNCFISCSIVFEVVLILLVYYCLKRNHYHHFQNCFHAFLLHSISSMSAAFQCLSFFEQSFSQVKIKMLGFPHNSKIFVHHMNLPPNPLKTLVVIFQTFQVFLSFLLKPI